jgi:hypothetical protein
MSYRAVLRIPHACRVFAAALLGRLSYGIAPLSLVLALTGATGSYAVAGGVMALFAVTVSVLAPVRAGLIDRHGPRVSVPREGGGRRVGGPAGCQVGPVTRRGSVRI